jgi:hypothetical protein
VICATVAKQSDVDGLWPLISADIIKCIEKTPTFFTAAELWVMCRSGAGFLIAVHEGTTIVGASVWRFEEANFVCLMLVGVNGKMRTGEDWVTALFERAAVTAKAGGARQLMASGRTILFEKLKKHLPQVRVIRCTVAVEI